VLEKVYAVLV